VTIARTSVSAGLSLAPFRALRPTVDAQRLGDLLCPPYDVIDDEQRSRLLARDPHNAVGIILPRPASAVPAGTADGVGGKPGNAFEGTDSATAARGGDGPDTGACPPSTRNADGPGTDPYTLAARRLAAEVEAGLFAPDAEPALYVYQMETGSGSITRGLLGAVELRDPADGVILPHENTMAGPVADRLALMTATEANLEPIYLVYDGGGAASELVGGIDGAEPIAEATTPDGTQHRLWRLVEAEQHDAVATDLGTRRALIADGHHRYATYRELQHNLRAQRGAGPWDRGLTLLVDSSNYGPQVHAIHRVIVGLPLAAAVDRARSTCDVRPAESVEQALEAIADLPGFAVVLAASDSAFILHDSGAGLRRATLASGEPSALADLDVTVLHRTLVQHVWQLTDSVEVVDYAHSVDEAVAEARRTGGTAVLLRPTPVADVAAVAAAGARMPRKSTLFTPKPASGLVMRRFVDEP
jgi:uncharacterized protein (DUF1015 family)